MATLLTRKTTGDTFSGIVPPPWFLAFAIALEIICVLFVRAFPLVRIYDVPLMDLGKLTHLEYGPLAAYLAGLLLMWAIYVAGYRIALGTCHRRGLLWLVVSGAVLALTLSLLYPVTANDLFDTFFNARILSHYHVNPLVVPAASFPNDPFMPYKAWVYEHAGDGPLWWELSLVVSVPAGANLLAGVLGLKLLVVVFFVASIPLVWLAVERSHPEHAFAATLLYAWNPVLLYEGAGNGHIDLVMMFYVLSAWCALRYRRDWLVLPILALSVLTKFVTALLIVPVVWYLTRSAGGVRRLALRAASGVVALALGAVVYAPLWSGLGSTVVEGRQQFITTSPAILLQYYAGTHAWSMRLASLVGEHGGTDAPGTLARYATYAAFGLCYLWFAWRAGRSRRELLQSCCMILFCYLAIATLWFQPWYLAWLVVPAALMPTNTAMIRRMAVFGISSLAPYYTFYIWVAKNQPLPWTTMQTITTLIIFVPVALLAAYDVCRWGQIGGLSERVGVRGDPASSVSARIREKKRPTADSRRLKVSE